MIGALCRFLCLIVISQICWSGNAYWQPRVAVNLNGNDNFSQRETNKNEVYSAATTLGIDTGAVSEHYQLNWLSQGTFTRYAGQDEGVDDFPAFESLLSFLGAANEVFNYSVDGRVRFDRTSFDEFDTVQLSRIDQDFRRRNVSLSLGSQYQLDETQSISGSLRYSELAYEDADTTALIDHEYYDSSLQWLVSVSETVGLFGALGVNLSRPDPTGTFVQQVNATKSDSTSQTLGVQWQISEIDRLDVSAGLRRSRFDSIPTGRVYETGQQYNVDFSRLEEFYGIDFNYSRSLRPTSDGRIVDADTGSINISYFLSEQSRTSLRLFVQKEETRGRSSEFSEELGETSVSYSTAVRKGMWVSLSLRHRREFGDQSAESNSASLSLSWVPERRFF